MEKIKQRNLIFLSFVIVVICVFVYFKSLGYDFVWDDLIYILNNPHLKDWAMAKDFFFNGMPTFKDSVHYRPITMSFMLLQYKLFLKEAIYYRIFSLILHLLCSIWIFLILQKATKKTVPSFWGALIFSVHPALVDAVAWISGFVEPLCGIFLFASFFFLIKFCENFNRKFFYLSFPLYFISIFVKEMALTFFLIFWLYAYFFAEKDKFKKLLPYLISYIIPAFIYISLRISILPKPYGQTSDFIYQIYYPILHYAYFVSYIFNPFSIKLIKYEVDLTRSINYLFLGAFIILFLFSIAFIAFLFRKRKTLLFAFLYFLITLIPVVGFIAPINIFGRYLYIPILGVLIIFTEFIDYLSSKKVFLAYGILVFIVLFFSFFTYQRLDYFKDNFTYFKRASEESNKNDAAYVHLAKHYQDMGDLEKAKEVLNRCIDIKGKFQSKCYSMLALVFLSESKFDEAEKALSISHILDHKNDEVFYGYGRFFLEKGDFERAYDFLNKAISLNPDDPLYFYTMTQLFIFKKDYETALLYAKKALSLSEDNVDSLNLMGIFMLK